MADVPADAEPGGALGRDGAGAPPLVERVAYPPELPVSARAAEIVELIRRHPVVVVAGETGSGKSTQLPKMLLQALGPRARGRIACTQPRRVAAVSVSRRVAEELGVAWGREVGCRIRFSDKTSRATRVKFLTDGMLLAEAQADPLLLEYDAVLVDEAHERSLNIDFLLGILRRLQERRPHLRTVITSATIDTAAFSRAFGDAPVVHVSGRTYPVEVIHAPLDEMAEEEGAFTRIEATIEAIARILDGGGPGDILVFQPTERDIREVCGLLEGRWRGALDVLPLYGRLPVEQQQRIFAPSGRRKVVVATNVAETSITVPGVRFVVDTGEARLARFHARTRTRRLLIEPVSQASADQRAGRCGRVGPGVCIRLYAEDDYARRPRFTPPEILRGNLAEVILRMLASGLGEPEQFPFVEPPPPAAIRAGRELLDELGATQGGVLTETGRELARLPLDPLVGRMVLQARREHALREVLVIAAALSVPDPRERPEGQEAAADAAHRRFQDPDSDFTALWRIWEAYHDDFEKLSSGRLRRFCKDHFLSFVRLRDWVETHEQLERVIDEIGGFRLDQAAPGEGPEARRFGGSWYRAVHRSLLPGLLANVARREDDGGYRATGDRRVLLFPGSGLFQARRRERGPPREAEAKGPKAPEWILAAEIVETSRVYARTVARVDPAWIVELGAHVIRRSHGDPSYEEEQQRVVVKQTLRLHGLPVDVRSVDYGRIDPPAATEIFIREALVQGRLRAPHPFLERNLRLQEKAELLRTRLRAGGVVAVEDAAYAWYHARLDPPVASLHDLNRVVRARFGGEFRRLEFTEADLLGAGGETVDAGQFPDEAPLANGVLPVHYRYNPGGEEDGATLRVPPDAALELREADLDWAVPALLEERLRLLLDVVPREVRATLEPCPALAARLARERRPGEGLVDALVRCVPGVAAAAERLRRARPPAWLRVRVAVVDEDGREIVAGRELAEVRAGLEKARGALARSATGEVERLWREARAAAERGPSPEWVFGDIPTRVVLGSAAGVPLEAFAGLLVEPGGVALRLFPSANEAAAGEDAAWEALHAHALRYELAYIDDDLGVLDRVRLDATGFLDLERLRDDARACLRAHLFRRVPPARTAAAFAASAAAAKKEARGIVYRLADRLAPVLAERRRAEAAAKDWPGARAELARLVPPRLLIHAPYERLLHVPRYLKALQARATKRKLDPARDAQRAALVEPWVKRFEAAARKPPADATGRRRLVDYFWLLEEYRVSVFAQELGTAESVSPAKLAAVTNALEAALRPSAQPSPQPVRNR